MFDALDLEQLLGRLSVLESWRDSVPRARAIEDADPVNWLRVKNAEAELEIPARSLVEVTGVKADEDGEALYFTVVRPTEDSLAGRCLVTDGEAIKAGKCGRASMDWPRVVEYAGDTPNTGEERGTAADSFVLTADQTGYQVLTVDTDNNLACISAAWDAVKIGPTYPTLEITSDGLHVLLDGNGAIIASGGSGLAVNVGDGLEIGANVVQVKVDGQTVFFDAQKRLVAYPPGELVPRGTKYGQILLWDGNKWVSSTGDVPGNQDLLVWLGDGWYPVHHMNIRVGEAAEADITRAVHGGPFEPTPIEATGYVTIRVGAQNIDLLGRLAE